MKEVTAVAQPNPTETPCSRERHLSSKKYQAIFNYLYLKAQQIATTNILKLLIWWHRHCAGNFLAFQQIIILTDHHHANLIEQLITYGWRFIRGLTLESRVRSSFLKKKKQNTKNPKPNQKKTHHIKNPTTKKNTPLPKNTTKKKKIVSIVLIYKIADDTCKKVVKLLEICKRTQRSKKTNLKSLGVD